MWNICSKFFFFLFYTDSVLNAVISSHLFCSCYGCRVCKLWQSQVLSCQFVSTFIAVGVSVSWNLPSRGLRDATIEGVRRCSITCTVLRTVLCFLFVVQSAECHTCTVDVDVLMMYVSLYIVC